MRRDALSDPRLQITGDRQIDLAGDPNADATSHNLDLMRCPPRLLHPLIVR